MNFLGPKSTIGIISQSSQELKLARTALKMGLQVVVLTEKVDTWKFIDCQIINGNSQQMVNLQKLFDASDVVLYNDDNIQLPSLDQIKDGNKLVQGTEILDLVQDSYLEKCFFNDNNLNIAPYATVVDDKDLRKTVQEIGFPCILKPIQRTINNKTRMIFHNQSEIDNYHLPTGSFVLESLVDIKQELFVLVSKDNLEQIQTYPIIKVTQQQNLKTAFLSQEYNGLLANEIQEIAQTIAKKLDYQGLFAIKLCITNSGMLYVERLYAGTVSAAEIYQAVTQFSQEELFLRSICERPLPIVQPQLAGCNLMITLDNLDMAVNLAQQHPQWKLTFDAEKLKSSQLDSVIGLITIFASNEEQLRSYVDETNLWKL